MVSAGKPTDSRILMPSQRFFVGLRTALAVAALFSFATGTAVSAEKVLHSFGRGTDGAFPVAQLIMDGAGNLYGTTEIGGIHNYGTVFELTPLGGGGWSEKVLHSFGQGTDGIGPSGSMVMDASGNLYGTTAYGGIRNQGTVFELIPNGNGGWNAKVLHSFGHGTDGIYPNGDLTWDAAGNLYGTTNQGGTQGYGTAFNMTPNQGNSWSEQVLYNFGQGTDGQYPAGGLVWDADGNLFSMTIGGGIHDDGTAFELSPNGDGSWTEKVLHSFGHNTDGQSPSGGLVRDAAGNLYGATTYGGIRNEGAVIQLAPQQGGSWTEKVLHSFGRTGDAQNPWAGLCIDPAGNLYGTSLYGGDVDYGTVFQLVATGNGGWTEQVRHNFGHGSDGENPYSGVIVDSAGNLFGLVFGGGIHGEGMAFEITP